MRNNYRNHEYYLDPTAGQALANIMRGERRRRRKQHKFPHKPIKTSVVRPNITAKEVPPPCTKR